MNEEARDQHDHDVSFVCPECGQLGIDDERVAAGMKCFTCAYPNKSFGFEPNPDE